MRHFHLLFILFICHSGISQTTVFDTIANSEDHSVFEEMLILTGVDEWLENQSYVTLFAPNNDALDSTFSQEELSELMLNENDALLDFVHNHIVLDTFETSFSETKTSLYGKKILFFIDKSGNYIVAGGPQPYPYLEFGEDYFDAINGRVYRIVNGALNISDDSPIDLIPNSPLLSIMYGSSYADSLRNGSELYTVLVPPQDSTIKQIEDLDLNNQDVRDSLARIHIISGHHRIQELYDGLNLFSWSDNILYFEEPDSLVHVNGIDIIDQCPTLKGNILILGNTVPSNNTIVTSDFAPIGAKWYFPETYAFNPNIGLVTFTSTSDDVIQNENVRVLYKDNGTCNGEEGNYYVLERNDSIFLYNQNIESFELQWINNAQIGDSWEINKTHNSITDTLTCVVDSISIYTLPNNAYSRVQHVTLESRYFDVRQTEIYDRMGFFASLFPVEIVSVCDGDFEGVLRCYEDDEVGLINFSDVGCLYTPVKTIENSVDIKLFPNPTFSKIYIESEVHLEEIKVFNTRGQSVFHEKEDLNSIDCSPFSSGIYFMYLITESGTIVRKILVE